MNPPELNVHLKILYGYGKHSIVETLTYKETIGVQNGEKIVSNVHHTCF